MRARGRAARKGILVKVVSGRVNEVLRLVMREIITHGWNLNSRIVVGRSACLPGL